MTKDSYQRADVWISGWLTSLIKIKLEMRFPLKSRVFYLNHMLSIEYTALELAMAFALVPPFPQ